MASQPSPSRRAQRVRRQRRRRRVRISVALLLPLTVAIVVGVVVMSASDDDGAHVVDIDMVEFGFEGAEGAEGADGTDGTEGALVAPAGPVRLSVTNVGAIPHNIGVRGGPITPDLLPGASAELDLGDLAPGTYELYCDVADHEELGMVATLLVEPVPTGTGGT